MRLTSAAIGAAVLALALIRPALAQSDNRDDCGDGSAVSYPDKNIGVCGLENTATELPYDNGTNHQGDLPFSVRSCGGFLGFNCDNAIGYRVRIDGNADSGNFLLTGQETGDELPISLAYTRGGTSGQLPPNNWSSAIFPGAAQGAQSPVSLSVSIPAIDPGTLPDTYGDNFMFSIDQEPCGGFWCLSTELEPIVFHLSIEVERHIRISGLGDMVIAADPAGLIQAEQSFCVYSQGGLPFSIAADSGHGSGSFQLADLDTIEYRAWVGSPISGSPEQLLEGQSSTQSWPGRLHEHCIAEGDNMEISIRIQPIAFADAEGTSYTDTLTLTVTLD
ncbi:hypothetical protein [Microbulbifer halophilus]|uniref:Spore coat protein U domain-containing protein n=1 Tax=Microbulbifer halophilus TaxID=453963 RepID=A0ABW5EAB6_9GAMM|nr:hypothetical protein [Microbulbifer halophilus]MCW8124985.1 hypothetical protein [Microbulbifer halophilus]